MNKIIYVTIEALKMVLNKDYGMKIPEDTKFVLTSESDKEREQNYVADLEAKLAGYECLMKKYNVEDLGHLDIMLFVLSGETKYQLAQLKQQLAEKDQATESWKTMYESVMQTCNNDAKEIERLREQLAEKGKEFEWLHQKFAKYAENNQDKISLAVAELEKISDWTIQHRVKPFFEERYIVYTKSLQHMIQEEIEQLKDGK